MATDLPELQAHLEPEGLQVLRERLGRCKAYLEYGSGGSTLEAASANVAWLFTVDTDMAWLERVGQELKSRALPAKCHLVHVPLGPVQRWGYPASAEHFAQFHRYSCAPWDAAQAAGIAPDLVFIDGRFRVASFLYSLASLAPGGTILFDDYADRPQYHGVEAFCKPVALAGRMAVFEPVSTPVTPQLMKLYAQYCSVPE